MSARIGVRGSLLLAAVVLTSIPVTGNAEQSPAAITPAAVTFADEFDQPAGTPVDGSKWVMETGDNVNNHERQYYTNSTNNAVHDGQGNLVITARRENPNNYQCWYARASTRPHG